MTNGESSKPPDPDREPQLVAMVDESYRVADDGHYVMAAAVAERGDLEQIRGRVSVLPPAGKGYFHWVDEGTELRERMLCVVEDLQLAHLVVAATPVGRKRQGRARAKCLERLMWELNHQGVGHVMLESRGDQDADDRRVIGGLRQQQHLPRSLTYGFGSKRNPELWVADAIAGAVVAARCDKDTHYVALLTRMTVIEIPGAAA